MTPTNLTYLIILGIAHFLGDYTVLSTNAMLSAKRFGEPLSPIAYHALVHAVLFGIATCLAYSFYLGFIVCLVQFVCHFTIDVAKGRVTKKFKILQDNTNRYYWFVFGFDQFLHYATIVLILGIVQ